MATNTPKLNLVKPEMSDFADIRVLNQNMDILDREVGRLDYVKNVVKSDTGLTFTKKDNSEIEVPLNYMPVTGGNFMDDITIKNNQVMSIVDSWYSEDESQYLIKYSDGRLEQQIVIDNPQTGMRAVNVVNLLSPYINTDYQVIVFQEAHATQNQYFRCDVNVTYGVDNTAEQAGAIPKEKNRFTVFTDTNSLVRVTCIGRWK